MRATVYGRAAGTSPFRTPVSEEALAPDRGVPQSALRGVGGLLDTAMFQNCEKSVAMPEQGRRRNPHLFVSSAEMLLAEPGIAFLWRTR
jgi:hypothetical protein